MENQKILRCVMVLIVMSGMFATAHNLWISDNNHLRNNAIELIKAPNYAESAMIANRNENNLFQTERNERVRTSPKFESNESKVDSKENVTVTFIYGVEDLDSYDVFTINLYNSSRDFHWYPEHYLSDGAPRESFEATVPIDKYDIMSTTFADNDILHHVCEQVNITKDTTIVLNVSDAKNRFYWELVNESNQLLYPDTRRPIDHEPWDELVEEGNISLSKGTFYLTHIDYGKVFVNDFIYEMQRPEGSYHLYNQFINDLSDKYSFYVIEKNLSKDGTFYINRLSGNGTQSLPLKNEANDYIAYEEHFENVHKTDSENNQIILQTFNYMGNDLEARGQMQRNLDLQENLIAKFQINASKENEGNELLGMNVAFKVTLIEGEERFVSPELMMSKNGSLEYLVHDVWVHMPESGCLKTDYPGHEKFSFWDNQKSDAIWNNCPINYIESKVGWNQYINANLVDFNSEYRGIHGEVIGKSNYSINAKNNGETIYSGRHSIQELLMALFTMSNPDGIYEITLVNEDFTVDDLLAENSTTICFDKTKEDKNAPTLKMLQFRDSKNNVTDRFNASEEGTILFSCGDFESKTISSSDLEWDYIDCQPVVTTEISYAPYGSKDWIPLDGVEHQSEYDDIPGMGFFYSGSLNTVSTPSPNGWYNLKIRLTDEAGNWQEQVISPAFKIDSIDSYTGISDVNSDNTHEVARYNLAGQRVGANTSGVVIVRYNDGTARKMIVK